MIVDGPVSWGTHDGFDIEAHLEEDFDTTLDDFETYREDDAVVQSWMRDDWHFVTLMVTASKLDVVLGTATLGGCHKGYFISTEDDGKTTTGYWLDPLDERDEHTDQIEEAVAEAKDRLARLIATTEGSKQ